MRCFACDAEIPDGARFCAACGSPASEPDQTIQKPANAPVSSPSSSGSLSHGRFVPGTMLGGRFRIVAMLGRGGMGEVVRADDLKLGQQVALKFLPPSMATDPQRLERLYNEVRIARQIAHPNVCRVYDIGEVDGEHFISMEYIEGEDLSTLLRRIGRLPEAKALQIARQLAAGMAAAHERGVLHRDLKPANVMLDERGIVRITDFGLAAVHGELSQAHIAEGTPAYMAPEQLAGKEVSPKSDIYALGLVLFEVFTGKRAFDADTTAGVIRQRQTSTPSAIAGELNPAIERVILHCLEADPNSRPASAVAVAAALPGGDPLAAALAAGETPSPDLLAAAGGTSSIRPSLALACLISVILGIVVVAAANDYGGFSAVYKLPRTPEQLVARAGEIASRLGYKEQPYSVYGFIAPSEFSEYLQEHDKSARRWYRLSAGHPTGLYFWFRESPRPLVPSKLFSDGRVGRNDPPFTTSGMVSVLLQPDGELAEFQAMPPQIAEDAAPRPVNWQPLLDFAGVDASRMQRTKSQWTPVAWGDQRAAWSGRSPEQPDLTMRLEAAAFQGKPISFLTIYPWTKPTRDTETSLTLRERGVVIAVFTLAALVFLTAALLARRNFRLGRGDRRGAFRFALALATLRFAASMFMANHVFSSDEIVIIVSALTTSLLVAALGWLLYIGIEPYVRRRWPQTLLSWNRLLLGQLNDALLGRDVLVGITASVVVSAVARMAGVFSQLNPAINPLFLTGVRQGIGGVLILLAGSLVSTIGIYVLLFVLRVISRRDWIAAAVFVVVNSIPVVLLFPDKAWVVGPVALIGSSISMILLFRFGIVALLGWNFGAQLLGSAPMTLNLSAWYGGSALVSAAVLVAISIYVFRTSLAGRQLFSEALLET